jgi:hypothetical protein
MINSEQLAEKLVSLWVERSVGSQESFGYVISDFLRNNPSIQTTNDVKAVLLDTKRMAVKFAAQFDADIPLHLSHKAFNSALDNFIDRLN